VKVKFVLDLWFESIFYYAFEDWENHESIPCFTEIQESLHMNGKPVLQEKYQSANWTLITKRERERKRDLKV
jgi:hypothetical protein